MGPVRDSASALGLPTNRYLEDNLKVLTRKMLIGTKSKNDTLTPTLSRKRGNNGARAGVGQWARRTTTLRDMLR